MTNAAREKEAKSTQKKEERSHFSAVTLTAKQEVC